MIWSGKSYHSAGFILKFVNVFCLLILFSIVPAAAQDDSSDGGSSGGVGTDYFYSRGGGNSDGAGGDTFNSNSDNDGGGDTFNSNSGQDGGGGGERPEPYPTPPPRFPCGPNALENQAWGGPAASGFLGMLSALIVPNCPTVLRPRRTRPIFTYYYINGINTPKTKDINANPDNWRGSCQSEHDTVAQNLIDRSDQVTWPYIPAPVGPRRSIKVANEIDTMHGLTCNPSGQDRWGGVWFIQNCGKPFVSSAPFTTAWWNVPGCQFLGTANGIRSGALLNFPLTPGDLVESVTQSTTPPTWQLFNASFPLLPTGIGFTANNSLVRAIANEIVQTYQLEMRRKAAGQPGSTNFFVIVGHSQGNFFAEGVAYRLYTSYGSTGQQIFWNRLGIISLASPTSYDSLPPQFIATKIRHRTRADDAINLLTPIGQQLASLKSSSSSAGFNINGKAPWPMNTTDPPLWSFTPAALQYVFSLQSLRPPAGCGFINWRFVCDIGSAAFWQLMGGSPTGVPNPELYAPFLNSHLLDNYLDDPPATKSGQLLSPNLSKYLGPNHGFGPYSPPAPPLLNTIRGDLFELKRTLLQSGPGTLQARMR